MSTVRSTPACRSGFSLVEVAIALAIAGFALATLLALLPVGVKTNQASYEETRAAGLLTMIEADLRNTHPATGSTSLIYGLNLPYAWNATNAVRTFPSSLPARSTVRLMDDGTTAGSIIDRPRFQATVIYQTRPAGSSQSLAPQSARVIVNWPALASDDPNDLTDPAKVSGHLSTGLNFPAP